MTRCAYVGNFAPEFSTENEVKIALETLGVEVQRFQENISVAWESLIEEAGDYDFVLWTTTHSFDVDVNLRRRALEAVRKTGTMVVGYHLDRWWGLERESQIRTSPFFTHTDLVCTADGGHDLEWAAAGIRHEWFPPAVSARHVGLATPDPDEYPFPIVFVGSYRTYHREWPWRTQMIQALTKRYRRQGLLGLYPMSPSAIRGKDLATLYATAKVVVGDSCLAGDVQSYWSDRVPETLGRGGILVHPWVWPIARDYPADAGCLWLYERENLAALFETIDKALGMSDEARLAARKLGVDHVGSSETYEHRMERLLDLVGQGSNRRRMFSHGRSAVFITREGSTDQTVIDETWRENVYRLDPEWVRDGTVVDLGANVGAVSVWAAVHGAAQVLAVEPDPANLDALRVNIGENPAGEIIEVCPYAVTGESTEPFHRWAIMTGKGGEAKVKDWLRDPAGVEAAPFREVFDGLDVVELLKLDIEGGEWEILTNPDNVSLIAEKVRRMVVEFHGPGMGCASGETSFAETIERLAEVGKLQILGRPSVGGLLWWEAYR